MPPTRSICSPWVIAFFAWRTESGALERCARAVSSACAQHLAGRAEAVHHAPGKRVLRAEGPRGQDQLLGASLADGARQVLRAPAPGMMPSVTSVSAKRAVWDGVGEIAAERQLQPAGEGRPLTAASTGGGQSSTARNVRSKR